MILPQTYGVNLFVMTLSILCMALWVTTFKLAGNWRFELYYFDFTFGLAIAAVIYAFTVGDLGYDGFNFLDDLQHAGKRQWLFCFLAGMIFNFANILLMSAVSVAGTLVAFPVAAGIGLIVGTLLGVANTRAANAIMALFGAGFLLASVVVNAMGYRLRSLQRHEALARAGKAKSTRRPTSSKGIILCVASGLLMGLFPPLLDKGRQGELGLGPFALVAMFVFGMFVSTLAIDIFFMLLPVEGSPLEFSAYFAGKMKHHALGVAGGMIWCTGMIAGMVVLAAPDTAQLGPAARSLLGQLPPLLTALLGIFVWGEISDADMRVRALVLLMVVLYTCGVVLLSAASLYARTV